MTSNASSNALNRKEKKRLDDCAHVYALARALEKLERAYVRSAFGDDEYERACVETLRKLEIARNALAGDGIWDLDGFLETYGARASSAMRRVEAGVPATMERAGKGQNENSNEVKYVAEATHSFITVLDTLKLDFRAKDQVGPALADLASALRNVARAPQDFVGMTSVKRWLAKLETMRASEALSDDEVRELLYEMESAYSEFMRILS